MQKIFVTYSIVASCHGKKYHFLVTTNRLSQYIVRMSCALHQNHHIILARTNHHCFFVLYFRTTLPGWVMSFSNFYYEYNYFSFVSFSETTVYLICFLHHTQASCVRIHHTDFSQNMAAIYSSELTPCFISQSHIHFLHISIIAIWWFCTATVRISFFITHIVNCLSVLLPSCNNFTCCLISLYANVHIGTMLILYLLPKDLFLYHSPLTWWQKLFCTHITL